MGWGVGRGGCGLGCGLGCGWGLGQVVRQKLKKLGILPYPVGKIEFLSR